LARDLAVAVAGAPRTTLDGPWERHVVVDWRGLTGSVSGGRWGPPGAYSVLYLARPRSSVVAEAYRHLVDPFVDAGMTGDMVAPRRVLTCDVHVTEVLDLRPAAAQAAVGLTPADLTSPVGEYERCWRVARVAHQLGRHGIIAPSPSNLGETLALFERHLPGEELPTLIAEETWDRLPADPRQLRLVRDDDTTA